VDAWLAGLDPTVLDWWLAFDRIEPISQPWTHTATLCAAVWEALSAIAAAQGVELPARKPEYWIPNRQAVESRQPTNRIDPEQLEAIMRRRFGC
jgi:hypothetical protein